MRAGCRRGSSANVSASWRWRAGIAWAGAEMTRPTWILLRGLARERAHWGAFPALLHERLGDATVVALDLPGNGCLNRQASPTRIALMTQQCRDEAARLGLAPPYHLLAISMGAMVAIDWARRD